jgi:hypothetical protein
MVFERGMALVKNVTVPATAHHDADRRPLSTLPAIMNTV